MDKKFFHGRDVPEHGLVKPPPSGPPVDFGGARWGASHSVHPPAPAREYDAVLQALASTLKHAWHIEQRGSSNFQWRHFTPASGYDMPSQGWKIHVSCATVEAAAMCSALIPRLIARHIGFKVPASLHGVALSLCSTPGTSAPRSSARSSPLTR